MGLVEAPGTDVEYDIDHVVLRVPDPAGARAKAWRRWAWSPRRTTGWRSATSTCASWPERPPRPIARC